jgi:hypothetical protein
MPITTARCLQMQGAHPHSTPDVAKKQKIKLKSFNYTIIIHIFPFQIVAAAI